MSKITEIIGDKVEQFRESTIGHILGGIYDVLERPVVQGAGELAHGIFSGSAYLPYGRGQSAPKDHDEPTPEVSKPEITPNTPEKEPEHEMEM